LTALLVSNSFWMKEFFKDVAEEWVLCRACSAAEMNCSTLLILQMLQWILDLWTPQVMSTERVILGKTLLWWYYIRLTASFSRASCVTRKINHSGFYWCKRWWGGSGTSWTICRWFAPRCRQITMLVALMIIWRISRNVVERLRVESWYESLLWTSELLVITWDFTWDLLETCLRLALRLDEGQLAIRYLFYEGRMCWICRK